MSRHQKLSWAEPSNRKLAQLAQQVEFPDFVKQASMEHLRPGAETGPGAFADSIRQDYPCHSREATWLSLADFAFHGKTANTENVNAVDLRLRSFARHWGLESERENLNKLAADKNANLNDADFAWVYNDGQVKHRSLRIKNAAEIGQAVQYLQQHAGDIPFDDRKIIAERILNKAASISMLLATADRAYLEKQAALGVPESLTAVVSLLQNRCRLLKNGHDETAQELSKVASAVAAVPSVLYDAEQLCKLARLLEQTDSISGILGQYTTVIPSPSDVLFAVTPTSKEASTTHVIKSASGNLYDATDLRSLKLADVRVAFGSKAVDQIRDGIRVDVPKLASFLSSAPYDQVRVFEEGLASKGIQPVENKPDHLLNVI